MNRRELVKTVGGTPVQNVGAYGQEVSETIVSVRCFDRKTLDFIELSNAECGFAYRTSIFNSTRRERFIVLSVNFALQRGGKAKVVYKDLVEHFAGRVAPGPCTALPGECCIAAGGRLAGVR